MTEKQQLEIAQVKKILAEGKCEVVFTKKNGETRKMIASTNSDYVKKDLVKPASSKSDNVTPGLLNQIRVYDIEKNGWRSFVFDNLISIMRVD